jgi:hypothetical protein
VKLCVFVLLLSLTLFHGLAHAQANSICPNSTVADAWGAEFASRAETFLASLQEAVRNDDATRFAALVQYPVRVINGTHTTKIATPDELIRKYSSVVTPIVKQAILEQTPTCLFGNYQGVMVGRGQVWFAEQPGRAMKIITVNVTTSGGS